MRNLRVFIEYDGGDFCGWQYQPSKRTVQGEIEIALRKVTNEELRIIGAGRTDQGVHALAQVANFHTASNLELCQIRNGMNSLTGNDIYIKAIERAEDNFHSRYSVKTKVYCYHIIVEPSPLKLRYNWHTQHKLNVSRMRETIPYFLGERGFKNFSASDSKDNTLCNIQRINLTEEDSRIIIEIEGNRFLRKMIRGIVGFMRDVGRGRFSSENTKDVFNGSIKDIYFAPPHGLFLVEVKY